jgi:hypothetical protein
LNCAAWPAAVTGVGHHYDEPVSERRALQERTHQREEGSDEPTVERSRLAFAVDRVRVFAVALWVRLVAGATWGVAGFHLGVALDAAGVPVVRTAESVVGVLPVAVPIARAGAAVLLATVLFAVGVLWTLRWDGETVTHRRRLVALVLLVVLPVVLSAVEMAVVAVADALLAVPIAVPEGPARAFYHVAATLAIAYGAAFLWYYANTEREHGRWHTYD